MPLFQDILSGVRSRADRLDQSGDWPQQDLDALESVGAMRWAVPLEFGGDEVSSLELHLRYEALAAASLATSFVLSQRDSGVGILAAAEASDLRDQLLTKAARNELFTTIGIAQLTTSRQRGAPALQATPVNGGFQIDGEIPWATGSPHCDFICAGAMLEDHRQMLFALPTDLPGVRVQPPMPLIALRASHTASVICDRIMLPDSQVLVHPSQQAMASRRKTVPIGQAFLAMGLCRGALDLIGHIDSEAARSALATLGDQLNVLRSDVLDFCGPDVPGDPARGTRLRGRVIDLALRTTHAAVSLYKGTGLLAGHPAQRLAREAMFLLVWSCPSPVLDCTLELLTQQAQADEGRGVKAEENTFVSRAGLKLDHALNEFKVDVTGMTCADFGSNTGGFVDCLLRRGASKVYAIDTGYGALEFKLRKDPRVVVMERTNAIHVNLPEPVQIITIDVAWTKQRIILPAAARLLAPEGQVITLIKPHYEAPPKLLRKGVLPAGDLAQVVAGVTADIRAGGFDVIATVLSPIKGAKGNAEMLAHLVRSHLSG